MIKKPNERMGVYNIGDNRSQNNNTEHKDRPPKRSRGITGRARRRKKTCSNKIYLSIKRFDDSFHVYLPTGIVQLANYAANMRHIEAKKGKLGKYQSVLTTRKKREHVGKNIIIIITTITTIFLQFVISPPAAVC